MRLKKRGRYRGVREQNCQDSVFGGGQRKGAQNDPIFHLGDQVDVVSLTEKGKQLWEQGNKILALVINMLIWGSSGSSR